MAIQTRTTALQNELVRLYFTFEYDGRLANPLGQPLVEILDTDGVTILDTLHASIESEGIYYADWFVPKNLPLGDYYDRWTFQWDSGSSIKEVSNIFSVFALETYINFLSNGIEQKLDSRAVQLMKDLANEFIYEAMHIPIYFETGRRVQQEDQQKRVKRYYYFTLDSDSYAVSQDAVYFNNNQRFTVFESLTPQYSSSSTSSESVGNTSSSSSSSSSMDSSSSSSSNSSSSSSISSESIGNNSSSSSSYPVVTTTTTTPYSKQIILTCVGTGSPTASGVLTKINGTGPTTITYTSYTEKTSRLSTRYDFAYPNWNQDPKPVVRINNRILDDGWHLDYNGKIYLDRLMAPEDSLAVSYNFAYFNTEEILSFLDLGLKMMNATPPSSEAYGSFLYMPRVWDAPVLLYAAITALKRLVFGLNWQEKAIIFGRPDDFERTQRAIDNFKALYTDYNTLWMEIRKDVKTLKLPSIAQFVTPEYTLPGGRSRFFRYLFKSGSG